MKIRWICENENVTDESVSSVEKKFGVKFPVDYIDIIRNNDGGYPVPNRFNLQGNEEVLNNLLSFHEEDCCYIVNTYCDINERLVDKIIPFAEDPFGNMICFDYRNDDTNPIVVFWDNEKSYTDKEGAIYHICDSFSELIQSLHESTES